MHLSVSFWFFASLAAAIYLGGDVALLLAAALVHEAGHAAAILLSKGRIESLTLSIFSARMTPRYRCIGSLRREAAVLAAGPAAGLLAAAVAAALGYRRFCVANLALSLFNLLPVDGIDGGALLRLGCARLERSTADGIVRAAQILTPGVLAVLATYRLWNWSPIPVVASAAFCLLAASLLQESEG